MKRWLDLWNLQPDGDLVQTRTSYLLPVRQTDQQDRAAILKLPLIEEERRGCRLMAWWDGQGAAPVLAFDGEALLLVRAEGAENLSRIAGSGQDDAANRVICEVAMRLHAVRGREPDGLLPLTQWFEALLACIGQGDDLLAAARQAALLLLMTSKECVVLHGDLHHGNILDFGKAGGWLAIDPKGLRGERGFDYANLFCNPSHALSTDPAQFASRVGLVCALTGQSRRRLLRWILAWAGLSAIWDETEGTRPRSTRQVAALARAALAQQ